MVEHHHAPRSADASVGMRGKFDSRTAVWHLRAPVLTALFQQLAQPGRLQPLGLVEVLDWTAAALDRVDREAFFARFDEGESPGQDPAVPSSTSPSSKPSTPRSAGSSASGTRRRRWSATWSPAWTAR